MDPTRAPAPAITDLATAQALITALQDQLASSRQEVVALRHQLDVLSSGDFNSAPRCGARTRRGTECQCPAIRGRTRCRLHGGKSTGPRTAEGLARIRAANTRHGRWSQESIALRRAINEFQANGRRSARSFPREFRDHIIRRCSEPLETRYVEALREMVRKELADEERQGLEAKAPRRFGR